MFVHQAQILQDKTMLCYVHYTERLLSSGSAIFILFFFNPDLHCILKMMEAPNIHSDNRKSMMATSNDDD